MFCHANFIRHEKPDGSFMNYYYNIVDALKQCRYDALVYLKASPEKCFDRIRYRSRDVENTIKFDYVRYLHSCYETHLIESSRAFNVPLVTIDWENFGSAEAAAGQVMTALDIAQPQKIRAIL
ncbi:MAG: deoxynucleoside kinase [Proteobacteria bacterium]|nr:deoxynucleoside kinase [Pseudomonadota bacterium]